MFTGSVRRWVGRPTSALVSASCATISHLVCVEWRDATWFSLRSFFQAGLVKGLPQAHFIVDPYRGKRASGERARPWGRAGERCGAVEGDSKNETSAERELGVVEEALVVAKRGLQSAGTRDRQELDVRACLVASSRTGLAFHL